MNNDGAAEKNLAHPGDSVTAWKRVKLLIIHSHFRPGGVRRVIELALPGLVGTLRPQVSQVVLAGGEAPDALWLQSLTGVLEVPVSCRIDPALGYLAEQRRTASRIVGRVRKFFRDLMPNDPREELLVWAHNQGLGRNLLLTRELVQFCQIHHVPLVLHHHDWWFDNRWQRWPEIRRSGFRSLRQVAETVFPATADVRALAINQADAGILERHFPRRAGWLPNPAERAAPPSTAAVRQARTWLAQQFGQQHPVWLMPCRLVRRKNIAEALLLTRWLRPEAWLVTTGGVSSRDEAAYGRRLQEAAQAQGWQLRLAVLQGNESEKPTVGQLMAASEAILSTSLQEGFGLPYVEASAAGRPLIARLLPNMAPDLSKLGFRFPQGYQDLLVAPCLFDWSAEQKRQKSLFCHWRRQLPRACWKYLGKPSFLDMERTPKPVSFGRLTLTAQFEVLAWPAAESFAHCAPLNPFLAAWRRRAHTGRLSVSPWPASASERLGAAAYARRFLSLLQMRPSLKARASASFCAQEQFLRSRLAAENLYPLLWGPES